MEQEMFTLIRWMQNIDKQYICNSFLLLDKEIRIQSMQWIDEVGELKEIALEKFELTS